LGRWVSFFVILFLILFSGFVQIFQHELVHGRVCAYIGGEEYYYNDWVGMTAYTGCKVDLVDQFDVSLSDFRKFNLVNEIVGYNLTAVFVLVLLFPFYNRIIREV